jgi:hypothetical protein
MAEPPTSPSTLFFAAKLLARRDVSTQPQPTGPPAPFSWDLMDLRLRMAGGTVTSAEVSTHFTLAEKDDLKKEKVALLALSFTYESESWKLTGRVKDLYLSMLWQFFDKDDQDDLIKLFGKIAIKELKVEYTYAERLPSEFDFNAKVLIGKLELDMLYHHDGTNWEFTFDVGSDGTQETTLQDVLNSIVDGSGNSLPSFVAGIRIPATTSSDSAIHLTVRKGLDGQPGTDGSFYFAFHIKIGEHFSFAMVQVSSEGGKGTKRILRFSVDQIPLIPAVPLLDSLPQPFDELEYMWVDGNAGWLQSEVQDVNQFLLTGSDKLSYKSNSGTDSKGKPPPGADNKKEVVIKPGHHFVVLRKNQVVLDHVFVGPSGTPAPAQGEDPPPPDDGEGGSARPDDTLTVSRRGSPRAIVARPMDDSAGAPPSTNAPTKGALDFTFGPLSVTAITLQFREEGGDKVLALTMDATFDLNPVTFSLLGFGIGIKLNNLTLDKLEDVGSHLKVELSGLALSFNKPPLMIAGGFEHLVLPGEEIYRGGIGVSFPPYTFVGLGEYKVYEKYKSIFLYAKLDGRKCSDSPFLVLIADFI